MTTSPKQSKRQRGLTVLAVVLLTLAVLAVYLATMAQTVVLGDPTEFTFVANMLGIAHPPGYAFITILGKLIQSLIPVGTIPWRMHLLSVLTALLACLFVFGTVHAASRRLLPQQPLIGLVAGLFAALSIATAVNHWQHAIHANPHIITGTFLAANLFFLTKWWGALSSYHPFNRSPGHPVTRSPRHPLTPSPPHDDRWLYIFSLSAGLGVTHHPLTVFGFLGYALFILLVRPSLLLDWRTLLKMIAFALLGLLVWFYFPIRSPMDPGFGPTTMNTLNGFLDHVLARGLSESLPYFGLADQANRQLVFYTLLRLQYTLPTILLALFGLIWLLYRCSTRRQSLALSACPLLLLYTLPVLGVYLFVISLRQQDIMAYLIGPFAVVGLWAGLGLAGVLAALFNINSLRLRQRQIVTALAAALFLAVGPLYQLAQNGPVVSLRHYREGQDYIEAVFDSFAGQGAVLLNDWEHMTPLWYVQFVEGEWPEAADVRPVFISTGGENPWLAEIFNYLPGGPVYLSNFRPQAVAGTEFRLRPSGPFYQVVEPGDETIPESLTAVSAAGSEVALVGYELPQTAVTAGDFVPLTLALRAPAGTADFYVPVVTVGQGPKAIVYEFTTDSHLTSPNWWPGEVIVERFDFALPFTLTAGSYPVRVDLKNLSRDETLPLDVDLGHLAVSAHTNPPANDHLLANFRQRAGLVSAVARAGGRAADAPWDDSGPLVVKPGDYINLVLEWESLARAEESYTVFVHLIDGGNVPHLALDYTPLGGATPTHLWIPKWLPGQRLLDPYRLEIDPTLPPGTYFVEVGLYEMVNGRRLHISDQQGNLNGDRYILGTVIVEEE